MKLVNVTAVSTRAQAPLQTGDLRLAVDVIQKISERSLEIIYQEYPDASKRAEKVKQITQVCLSIFSFYCVAHEVFSRCILECNAFFWMLCYLLGRGEVFQ